VFIGLPPECHGSSVAPRDVETECAKRGIHMFIEKPLSCSAVNFVESLGDALKKYPNIVASVGYMFRYSKAILKMKEIISQNGEIRAFNARYDCAYSTLSKEMWWDVDRSGGPIVEQATHFCDLARFLGGEIDLDSVRAISIKQTDRAGTLEHLPKNVNESSLPAQRRIPRVTSAFWKFKSGAIGSLMHAALLHEVKYEAELEVWGDGYRIVLIEPYSKCRLSVRLPHSEESKIIEFYDDDCYYNEDKVFLEAVKNSMRGKHDVSAIQSPYEDAVNTYKMTWKIKEESEKS